MTPAVSPAENWVTELRQSLRTAEDLYREGLISETDVAAYTPILERYQFLLPRYYASLIDRSDPDCPIRRQALPDLEELNDGPGFLSDPLQDLRHQPRSRATHRYRHRVLLHLTPNCSMYCRFCFRKTLLNELTPDLFGGALEEALDYVAQTPTIHEVIFSGGDPFLANQALLGSALSKIKSFRHVRRLRFHTRVPVTLPSRVTEAFVEQLAGAGLPWAVVCHFNHPREITLQSIEACARLRAGGATLLNQSVLLKNVNDNALTLCQLSESLYDCGVLPYYLHHPDRAKGTGHFDVPLEKGNSIWKTMRATLPGYLVPKYVIDVVGSPYKVSVEEHLSTLKGKA